MMNKFWVTVVVMAALAVGSAGRAADTNLSLKLEGPTDILRVKQEAKLKLKIVGKGIGTMVKGAEGADQDEISVRTFTGEVVFTPKQEGAQTLGPYTVTVNGQKLVSNSLAIRVLPAWDGKFGTMFVVDKPKAVVGEELQLIIETRSDHQVTALFAFRGGADFVMGSTSSSSSTSISGGESVYCVKQIYTITPSRAGDLKINKDSFSKFPDGVAPPNITVEVAAGK
jgi:hypothetical protein